MEQDTLSPLFMQTDTTNTSSGSIDGSDMTSAQPHSHLKAKKKRGPYKKRQNENRQCVRCGTRESPAWRCKRTGFLMCNACGIWMKKHGGGCKAWLIDGANNNNNNNIR
jgi:hypothetical protein